LQGTESSFAQTWLSLATIVILQGIALYTWQFRKEPGAKWQAYVQVSKGIWLFSILMINQSAKAGTRNLWHGLYTLLALSVCYFWLRCIAEISGAVDEFAGWFLPLVRGTLLVLFAFVLSNGWHHLYWRSVDVVEGVNRVQTGPVGYVALLFGYGLIGYSIWINIRWAHRCKGLRRRQAWMFVLPTCAAWLGQFLGYLPHPRELEPHTIGFLVAGILMAWAFLCWRAYSILPLAEKTLVQSLADGVVVIDDARNIVALNDYGKELFGACGGRVGGSITAMFGQWPMVASLIEGERESPQESVHGERIYLINQTALRSQQEILLGEVLHFKDVTLERQQQRRILEQQKSLATLRERERLGRELHDGPSQMWSFLAAQTQATRILLERGKTEQADLRLEQMQKIIQEVYGGLRESISTLQSGLTNGLVAALEAQLSWCREYCAIETHLDVDEAWNEEMLSSEAQAQILRIMQEALANVRKSAKATRVHLRVERSGHHVCFSVQDDGCGFDPAHEMLQRGRHGLGIMSERAHEIGADLRVVSAPGAGATIHLRVPLRIAECCAILECE